VQIARRTRRHARKKAAKTKVKINLGFSTTFCKNKGKYIIKLELLIMNDKASPIIIIKVHLSK
jgi:hypothetical protein